MRAQIRVFLAAAALWIGVPLCCFPAPVGPAWAGSSAVFNFQNAEIATVIKEVGELTGTTFLFDPERVKGRITLLAPKPVSPAEALELLKSALDLHGYMLVRGAEATWIVPARRQAHEAVRIKVIPLQYARAEELAR